MLEVHYIVEIRKYKHNSIPNNPDDIDALHDFDLVHKLKIIKGENYKNISSFYFEEIDKIFTFTYVGHSLNLDKLYYALSFHIYTAQQEVYASRLIDKLKQYGWKTVETTVEELDAPFPTLSKNMAN